MKIQMPSPALVISCIALAIALMPAVHAANTIFSTDIVDGEVKTDDLATYAVNGYKLAPNSVASGKVADHTLFLHDLKGADAKGTISLAPLSNGRCTDLTLSIPGAAVGEVPLMTLTAAPPNGLIFHAARVSSAGHVIMNFCNLSGVTSLPISNLGIRVVTFD